MKLADVSRQGLFDHNDQMHKLFIRELDTYMASGFVKLSLELKQYLRGIYKDRPGSKRLYRSIISEDLSYIGQILNIEDYQIKPDVDVVYSRNKESSWTKQLRAAKKFSVGRGGFMNVVIMANVPVSNFLLDTDDLSKEDQYMLDILPEEREVIVDHINQPATIVAVIQSK